MDPLSAGVAVIGTTADILSLTPLFSSPLRKAVTVSKRRHRRDESMRAALEAARESGELDYYAEAIVRGLPRSPEQLAEILSAHRGLRSEQAIAATHAAAQHLLADIESALLRDDSIRLVVSILHQNEAQRRSDQERLEGMMSQMLKRMEAQEAIPAREGENRHRTDEAESRLREQLQNAVKALNEDRVEDALQEVERSIEDLNLLHTFLPDERYFRQSALILKAQVYTLQGQWPERTRVIQAIRNGAPLVDDLVLQATELAAVAEDEEWLTELLPRLVEDEGERAYAEAALHWIRRDVEGALQRISDNTENPDLLYMKAQALTYRLNAEDPATVAEILKQLDEAEGLQLTHILTGRLGTHLLQRVITEQVEAPGLDRAQLVRQTRDRFDRAIAAYEPMAKQHPIGYLQALSGKMTFLSFLFEEKEAMRLSKQVEELQPRDLPIVAAEMSTLVEDEELIERLASEKNETPVRLATVRGARAARVGDIEGALAHLQVALREAKNREDYTRALQFLVHLYFEVNLDAASTLLDQDHPLISPSNLAYLRVQLVYRREGLSAAIQSVDEQLQKLPRSLSLLRLKYDILNRRLNELIERRKQGEWLGRNFIQTYEAMEQTARDAYDLLPCPKHKALLAAPLYNLGNKEEARRLTREAQQEGLSEDELPVNLTTTDQL